MDIQRKPICTQQLRKQPYDNLCSGATEKCFRATLSYFYHKTWMNSKQTHEAANRNSGSPYIDRFKLPTFIYKNKKPILSHVTAAPQN